MINCDDEVTIVFSDVDDDKQKKFLIKCAENLKETLDSHLSKPSAPDPDVFKMIDIKVRIVYSTVIVLMVNTAYENVCVDR
jgi:hypothetical protein